MVHVRKRLTCVLIFALLPLAQGFAQDLDAVDRTLAKCVVDGKLTLRQASAMMQTLRALAPKENAELAPKEEGHLKSRPPAKLEQTPWLNHRDRYAKFDLAKNADTIEGLISSALSQKADLRFEREATTVVIESIKARFGLPVKFRSSKANSSSAEKTVSIDVSNVSLSSALRLALAPLELTYVIENEVLWVMPRLEAQKLLEPKYRVLLSGPDRETSSGTAPAKE